MDPFSIQAAKNKFAESQTPPIEPCTNSGCKFTGCTCGTKCGCHVPKQGIRENTCGASNDESCGKMDDDGLIRCDPCKEFKIKKTIEMQSKE